MTYEQARDECRQAWSRTQMQLSLDDVLIDRLDSVNETGVRGRQPIDERALPTPSRGALASGAGPCCGHESGVAPAPATADDHVSFPAPSSPMNGGSVADSGRVDRDAPAKGV